MRNSDFRRTLLKKKNKKSKTDVRIKYEHRFKNTLRILKMGWNDISKWKGPLSSKLGTSFIKIKTKQKKK